MAPERTSDYPSMQSRSRFVRLAVFVFHCWAALIVATLITLALAGITNHFTGERFANVIFGGPFFIAFLAVGFCLGFWINRWLKSTLAKWVWVPALVLFCICLQDQIRQPGPLGPLHGVWVDYFGNNGCGGTECLGELFATWPLFSAISYSIGSSLGRRKLNLGLPSKRGSILSK